MPTGMNSAHSASHPEGGEAQRSTARRRAVDWSEHAVTLDGDDAQHLALPRGARPGVISGFGDGRARDVDLVDAHGMTAVRSHGHEEFRRILASWSATIWRRSACR